MNPEDRKEIEADLGTTYALPAREAGVYLWYVNSDIASIEMVARRCRIDPPPRFPVDRPDLALLSSVEDLQWPPAERLAADTEFAKYFACHDAKRQAAFAWAMDDADTH